MLCIVVQSCPTLCDPMGCNLSGSSVHGDSPGKNTGVGCHALLQGIFPTRDWTQVSRIAGRYCLSHQGSPRILESVAYAFSRGSSGPRNQTGVSCIVGEFFTSWVTREYIYIYIYICFFRFLSTVGCFHTLTTINSVAVNTGVHVSFWVRVSLDICPRIGLLDHLATLCLAF